MNLNELFALPINLKHVATIGGIKLYGSDGLNKNFIDAISESKSLSAIKDIVKKLVEKKKIIPIFANSDIINHLFDVVNAFGKGYIHSKHIMALYTSDEKSIFVFIDNNTNIVWYVNNDDLSKLVVHELMHMVADERPNLFLTTFKPELLLFYKDLFVHLFKLKDGKKLDFEITSIFESFFKHVERTFEFEFKKVQFQLNKLRSYSSLDKSQFDKVILDYFRVLKFHFTEQYEYIFDKKFRYIVIEPYLVYKRKFKFLPKGKNCLQELILPSEVISTISEFKPSQKHYKSIKSLI